MPVPTTIFVEGGSGQVTRRGTPFPSRIIVRVFDENSNWLPNEEVKFSLPLPLTEPTGRFPGGVPEDTVLTDAIGRAVSEVIDADPLVGTWLGRVESVANPLVRADFYLSNEASPRTPNRIVLIENDQQIAAQFTPYEPVTARLVDEFGDGVPSTFMNMSVASSDLGTFPNGGTGTNALTDAGGYATFPPLTAGSTLGIFDPHVTYPGLSFAACQFQTIDAAAPYAVVIVDGNNQAMAPTFRFTHPLVAGVVNAIGDPLAGWVVTFTTFPDPTSLAGLTWTPPATEPASAITDINGLATSPSFSANANLGSYVVFATAPGALSTIFSLTNGGEPPPPETNALAFCEV